MSVSSSSQDPKPRPRGRGVLLAGVAAAALMGVGLGLWARPAMSERKLGLPAVEALKAQPARILQIVIDDAPAPLGAPIEVLSDPRAPVRPDPPRRLPPEPMAPVRPATGLLRVQSVDRDAAPVAKAPTRPPRIVAQTAGPAKPKIVAVSKARPRPTRAEPVKLVEKARVKPAEAVAKSEVSKPSPVRPQRIKAVRHDAPRPEKPKVAKARIETPRAKTPTAQKARLIRAAKPARVDKPVVRIMAHKPSGPVKTQKIRLERKIQTAAKPKAAKVIVRAAPPKSRTTMKGAGPLRVAKAMPRPDPALRDADRQLTRAYSTARAAGVPDWQLRRQQARWESARTSAAKEAPWAVHDVYLARIAELHDLTRNAQAPGY